MNRIIITGGAGFVGHALATVLAGREGHELVLVDNLSRGRADAEFEELLQRPNVSFVNADLTNAEEVGKLPTDIDYVYHLAALIGVKHVMKHPDQVLKTNLMSVLMLFDHLKRCRQLKRVVFSSTSEVYAGTLKHYGMPVPTPESTPIALDGLANPRTSYALSKITGEAIVNQYAAVHGIPVTNLRYHNVYGPRMGFAHVVPETMIKIAQGGVIPVPSPTHTRAFCHISDAVGATIAAAESEETLNETVNVGNGGEEVTVRKLVETIADVMGASIEIEEKPDTPGSPARRCPDISKLTELTGFQPAVCLREGLEDAYKWYEGRLSERTE